MPAVRPPGSAFARDTRRAGALIPTRLLIAAGRFGPHLPATAAAAAIARGVVQAGRPAPDVLALEGQAASHAQGRSSLEDAGFDARMRDARAVVLAWEHLELRSLLDGVAFEIATRARQGGVPAYAITREDELGAFGARMLDLQLVLVARGARGLAAAGRALGGLA